ncbi:hypothetical protein BDN70DRAFT_998635 [Pholiota conissans]|uniref:Uncharacterized protein n=1 Tax=Pholiota conissans TaxID=109636 RepID=A0A9P6CTA8_9AGAR|nr:hypothetical protein BDN70DRAFT_998635 [Pholiota conissans]
MKRSSATYSSPCGAKAASILPTRKYQDMWPHPPRPALQTALSAGDAFLFLLVFILLQYISCTRKEGEIGYVQLPEDQDTKLMAEHVPTSPYFSEIAYSLSSTSTSILSNVSRIVKLGQIMAIMSTLSASTTGKSTFLDILWWMRRSTEVSGTVLVNGRKEDDENFKKVVGALLRLSRSREINDEARKFRMREMLAELGILDIKYAYWG